jgi:acetyltransferase
MSVRNLEALFQPASVAVIGASDREGSLGAIVMRNLKAGGFKGAIWPVNRRHSTVGGQPSWPDVESLPQAPDLAVICTLAPTVPELVTALGSKGAHAAIVLAAGTRQSVLEGEPTLEQAMLDAARPHLLRILGGQSLGVQVPAAGLNASCTPDQALPGTLAFVTQSGMLGTAVLDWAKGRGIGFSHFVSLGDSVDVDLGDALDYLGSDSATRAILVYMESVGQARKFMSAARAAARNKPVIVVKAGRAHEEGRAAPWQADPCIESDEVFDAAVRRAGMLRVGTLEALFDAAETLARAKAHHGQRLAILANGRGAGTLAADALARGMGQLADLSDATMEALNKCLPAPWSHANPIDVTGDAQEGGYQDALRLLLAAPEVDAVLFMHAPSARVPAGNIAAACLPLMQQAGKPVLVCWLGGMAVAKVRAASRSAGVPCYGTPERAVAAWLQMADHARNQDALQQLPVDMPEDGAPDRARALEVLEEVRRGGEDWLNGAQAQVLLDAYGIPAQPTRMAHNMEEAVAMAVKIGFPVALKILSSQILRKSEVGGVALGLASGDEVRTAAVKMRQSVARLKPRASVLGFTVQPMASRPEACELTLGIACDPVFGPVVFLGEGGSAGARARCHVLELPPLNSRLALDMVSRCQRELIRPAGIHGATPVDAQALVSTLLKVSRMACELPMLAQLQIHPLVVDAQGVLALDASVRVHGAVPPRLHPLAIQPYPPGLEETLHLAGHDLRVRPIRPEDGQRLTAFYAQTTPSDMRLRFFMARREVSHSELARYSQIDYDREMTFIALAPQPSGGWAMAAEVRAVCDPDNDCAEFAIQVASDWQGKGLGRLMMDKLLRYLRGRGTAQVVGECLLENACMASLARAAGFEVSMASSHDTMLLRLALH